MVQYTHILGDPFVKGREIVGAYMVIKNRRGEFLETLNQEDIQKIRSVAKTQAIWTAWLDRMILKSMMKRSCKMHFNDITGELDKVDNEENDLEKLGLESDVQVQIENAGTLEELQEIYVEHKETTENQPALMAMLGARKKELKKQS